MDMGALIGLVSVGLAGVLGLAWIFLDAYKVRLQADQDRAQIAGGGIDDRTLARIEELEDQVDRLTERADFTERLLGSGGKNSSSDR